VLRKDLNDEQYGETRQEKQGRQSRTAPQQSLVTDAYIRQKLEEDTAVQWKNNYKKLAVRSKA